MKKKYYPFLIIGILMIGIFGLYYLVRRSSKLALPYLLIILLTTLILLYLTSRKED